VLAGLSSASGIGAPPIVKFGTEKQKDDWLPGIFTGETVFCLGATEPSGGSDLAKLKTTAVKTECGKYYIVNGHKVSLSGKNRQSASDLSTRNG
jgi:alkylation response protein AidB-like acyl-CoA dehydrogenase